MKIMMVCLYFYFIIIKCFYVLMGDYNYIIEFFREIYCICMFVYLVIRK